MSNSKCLRNSETLADNSEPDFISKLPDGILVYILDKLPLEEAMCTSILSKRWNGLWRYKRKVELDKRWVQKTGKKVLPSAFRIFHDLREQSMQSISISLKYNLSMFADIQSLIAYASMKKVEELYIDFNEKQNNVTKLRRQYPSISIPECDLRHSSVVKLSLMSLQLETLPPRSFKALKELFFARVKLSNDSVQDITANCPSLAFLSLSNCNPNTDLKVVVAENSNLLHLVISEELNEVSSMTTLCIKARVLESIEFALALPRRVYQLEPKLVCSKATFRLDKMHHSRESMRVTGVGIRGHIVKNFWVLLNKLKAANVLTLSSWCIQVLAVEVAMNRFPLNFEVQHLTLETGLMDIWEFRGIAYLLLGCTKLEHLVIVMGTAEKINFSSFLDREPCCGPQKNFGKILQNLAIVEFRNYNGRYQIWEDYMFREDLFFTDYTCGRLLLWNLKFFASKLQTMKFISAKKRFETREFGNLGEVANPSSAVRWEYCWLIDLYKSMQQRIRLRR